jgi:hypothetical protein
MTLYSATREKATWNTFDEEAVLIHTETSSYFTMNQTGTWLWNRMAERPYPMDQLLRVFTEHYQLDERQAEADLHRFLLQLGNADLLTEGVGDDAATGETVQTTTRQEPEPYEPPDLVRFGDLDTLILSGE